jgi:hypothetical protein
MSHRRLKPFDPQRLRGVRISLIRRALVSWEGRDESVMMLDVGLRGVYVEHARAPAPGTAAVVSFTLPENEIPLVVPCRVAWRHTRAGTFVRRSLPPGCGLEFQRLDPAGERRLLRHLHAHLDKSGHARRFVARWPDADEYLAEVTQVTAPAPEAP